MGFMAGIGAAARLANPGSDGNPKSRPLPSGSAGLQTGIPGPRVFRPAVGDHSSRSKDRRSRGSVAALFQRLEHWGLQPGSASFFAGITIDNTVATARVPSTTTSETMG